MSRPLSPLEQALGHVVTVAPTLVEAVWPTKAPPSQPWHTVVEAADGPVQLTGHLARPEGATTLVVLVHGLGGSAASWYLHRAAAQAAAMGLATLRVNLRGADRSGAAIYHAGLTEDLHAIVRDRVVARFERVHLLGFSLGGHVVLRAATEDLPDHVGAVAAISPPIDLAAGAAWIDRPAAAPYRRHVLSGLVDIYRRVAARRPVPCPVEQAARIRSVRAWDEAIVAPTFGFHDADDYYARMSVAGRLDALQRPALLVHADADPMIGPAVVAPAFAGPYPHLEAHRIQGGGHVLLPDATSFAGRGGGTRAVLAWLAER